MRNIVLVGLIVAFAAAVSASAVRANHDPANECLGRTQTIRGTVGNDTLTGTPGDDVIKGLAGDDTIDGGGGRDVICGEEGNDTLIGGEGDDSLNGGAGDDRLDAGNGLDLAFFREAAGPVTASLQSSTATGDGNDTLVALEGLSGSRHNDVLQGNDGDNLLDGLDGNDVLLGGRGIDGLDGDAGNDVLDGGPGVDFVYYYFAPRGITANLGTRRARGWGTDVLRGIEDIEGSPYADALTGDVRTNTLNGDAGADRVAGGGGNDMLLGDGTCAPTPDPEDEDCIPGADRLFGGAGRDVLRGNLRRDYADGGPGRDRCFAERKRRCP